MDALPILDLINREVTAKTAKRLDPIGEMAQRVLMAADPDAAFQEDARHLLRNYPQVTRRLTITMLGKAFGIGRPLLKSYLRAHGLCGAMD